VRLWSLDPRYLDSKGLVALWREALLAQAVLMGRTKGYKHHPQLARFSATSSPEGSIAEYLRFVQEEAKRRGYRFDGGKISPRRWRGRIEVPRGQMDYEWKHLLEKLDKRSRDWLLTLEGVKRPLAHPLFRVVQGGVAPWERPL